MEPETMNQETITMNLFLVYMTAADTTEARAIGKYLVQAKLAACVNILDHMNSMYVWKGEFHDEQEAVLIAKTSEERIDALIAAVKDRHSYECPCIVTLPIKDGNPDFLNWIADQVE